MPKTLTQTLSRIGLTGLTVSMATGLMVSSAMAADPDVQIFAQQNASAPMSAQASVPAEFSIFAPKAQTRKTRLDWDVMDDALQNAVLDFGESLRRRASKPRAESGTRFVRGHDSPYRLEGSRVIFSRLNDSYVQSLTEYRQDLERIATENDLTRFSRNEQLAFWLNLHNIAQIEQIAINYPVETPSKMTVRINGVKQPVDTAKFMTIRGVPLSLRDIRENIVFANWPDERVIYGFFRGNVGGPRLEKYAFKAPVIDQMLTTNAREFVNSLRGFNTTRRYRNISKIYEEVAPFYFKNFEADLERHLRRFANEKVREELSENKPFRVEPYETIVADLAGGNPSALSGGNGTTVTADMQRMLREADRKFQIMRAEGLIKPRGGVVIIEDLVTDDTPVPAPTPPVE